MDGRLYTLHSAANNNVDAIRVLHELGADVNNCAKCASAQGPSFERRAGDGTRRSRNRPLTTLLI